jgi:hypothetical protein
MQVIIKTLIKNIVVKQINKRKIAIRVKLKSGEVIIINKEITISANIYRTL